MLAVLAAWLLANGDTTLSLVVTAIVSGSAGAAGTFGIVGKRKDDLADVYKRLYEAKLTETDDMAKRITRLESQVNLFQSNFVSQIAAGVTDAVVKMVHEKGL